MYKLIQNQQGAMFGLDARIALAIFGVLSIVAGTYAVLSLSDVHAKSLSRELNETSQAIESFHKDVRDDIHATLIEESDVAAFEALFDKSVMEPGKARSRWVGPYVKATTSEHPRFGNMRLTKRPKAHDGFCYPEDDCFIWLIYERVAHSTVKELNKLFDGEKESKPEFEGRVQWDDTSEKAYTLWFRTVRALRGNY